MTRRTSPGRTLLGAMVRVCSTAPTPEVLMKKRDRTGLPPREETLTRSGALPAEVSMGRERP